VDAFRLVICGRGDCRQLFFLCRHCDRGDRYCSRACAQAARRTTLQGAGARYQRTRPGRRRHAARRVLPRALRRRENFVEDVNESYFAFRDTLDQGGAGLIERLFDGVVTGQTPIPASAFPHRDLADPDGSTFPITSAALFQLFAGLGEAEA
jgi:hypothetical protein